MFPGSCSRSTFGANVIPAATGIRWYRCAGSKAQVWRPGWPIELGGAPGVLERRTAFPGADWDNKTGRPEETDGENPEGSIGQDGSKCVKQDGTSLSPTSSTPKVRLLTAARRTLFRRHHEPGGPANAGARRAELRRTLGIVALAALMGLTSWVVASLSTWLVPVYVTAMVLIFVIPRVQRPGEPEQADGVAGVSAIRASGTSSPASPRAEAPGATTLAVDGSPGAAATGTELPGSTTAKRRRSRGRGRKPVKPGTEPAVAPAPATWIRIGPGKFVRADSQEQVHASAPVPHATVEAAEAATVAAGSPPDLVEETDSTAGSTAADVPTRADLNEAGPSPLRGIPCEEPVAIADPEADSPSTGLVLEADAARQEFDSTVAPETIVIDGDLPANLMVPDPDTEEYGIAPSAFGPSLLEASLEEEDHEPGRTALPNSTGIGTEALADAGSGSRYDWMRLKPRSSACATAGCLPRPEMPRQLWNVRSEGRSRSCAASGVAANRRARTLARRNDGRSPRTHRGFQPRSPPARS